MQCIVHLALPGKVVQGTKLVGGNRLTYKLTGEPLPSRPAILFVSVSYCTVCLGQACLSVSMLLTSSRVRVGVWHGIGVHNLIATAAVTAAVWVWRPAALIWVHDQYLPLFTASLLFSVSLSAYLYTSSFWGKKQLANQGSSGYVLYDFFMGRELNPRLGNLDLKEFCELYPGLSGLVSNSWPRSYAPSPAAASRWQTQPCRCGQGCAARLMRSKKLVPGCRKGSDADHTLPWGQLLFLLSSVLCPFCSWHFMQCRFERWQPLLVRFPPYLTMARFKVGL